MNLTIFVKCMRVLENAYPRFEITNDKDKLSLWHELIGKDTEEVVFMLAIKKYIINNEFPPTIAGIKKEVSNILTSGDPDTTEAWSEVQKSIRRYGMYRETEALESLSEETRNVVKAIGFQNLCTSVDHMADRAHFIRLYESRSKKKHEHVAMGPRLTEQIKQLAQSFSTDEKRLLS